MGKGSWYRKTTWTPADEKEFFTRLQRARSTYHKAQYLRIQADCLQKEFSPPQYEAALDLLERLLVDFPDPNELGSAYLQKAQCCEALGQYDEALQAYKSAIQFSKNQDGIYTTDAPVHFAIFVAKHQDKENYDEALQYFEGADMVMLLPTSQYGALTAMAIIAEDTGKKKKAETFARQALELINQNDGAAQAFDEGLRQRLIQIAGAKNGRWGKFWKTVFRK
jgi:tetratricopeptide (TPR) repeat protein